MSGALRPGSARAGRGRVWLTIAGLAVMAAVLGWWLGSRSQGRSFAEARALFERGTAEDLGGAAELLAFVYSPPV